MCVPIGPEFNLATAIGALNRPEIGSSSGFEDEDFKSIKLRRPIGSYYHATEDCLYLVDSEFLFSRNHAIRKADMRTRIVDTLHPTSASKGGIRIWNWIMGKLGLESYIRDTNVEERLEAFEAKSLYYPWHLLKSVNDTLYIIDRR
ncbi:hypothetical protein RJT34_01820 [Clitoria ternatea]|uniref:Uncharacterized protein n=1 Tax=Clitoria ternatea TaxID=43366 RepID=A0AAN9KGK7_CLITE